MVVRGCIDERPTSRRSILALVFLALLLDNVLLTVVVPIIPDFLVELEVEAENVLLDDYLFNVTGGNWSNFHLFSNATIPPIHNHTWRSGFGFPVVPQERLFSDVNSRVGWLFASKAIVQLCANGFIGSATNRYGPSVPMFVGFVILMVSSLLYALGQSYWVLFAARAIQGVSSSCTAIAGMSLLASTYPEDGERSKAMGIAMGGIALGVLIGYPFGGVMYEFVNKSTPFLIIATVALLEGALQIWLLRPQFKAQESIACGTSLRVLLQDPYILIASGAILFPEMAVSMLEACLPVWLEKNMHAAKWQLGTVFIPDSIGYVLGTNIFGMIAHKLGRWICSIVSLTLMGVSLACIPFARNMYHLIGPHFGIGLSLGVVDASIMPLLALLVEQRHLAVYGSVYAIAQVSISLGFAIGPSLGGEIVEALGFPWLIRGMGLLNILFAPLCYFLRKPPQKEENKSILLEDQGLSYTEEESFSYRRLNN